MPVASVSEEIQVTAESPIIDVKQNAATASIQAEIIDRIPKGRNFTSVLTSAPGHRTTKPRRVCRLTARPAPRTATSSTVRTRPTCGPAYPRKPVLVDFLAGSSGQVQRLQRRVPCDDRRRHQRDHEVGQQHRIAATSARTTPNAGLGGRRSADAAPEPGEPDAGRVHRHAARLRLRRSNRSPISAARSSATAPGSSSGYGPQIRRRERTVTFTSNSQLRDVRRRPRRPQRQLQRDLAAQHQHAVAVLRQQHPRIYGRPVVAAGHRAERHQHLEPDAVPESAAHRTTTNDIIRR